MMFFWGIILDFVSCIIKICFIYISGALNTTEVADRMALSKMGSRKWFVQGACATTGEGIYEAMKEMAHMVKETKKGNYFS